MKRIFVILSLFGIMSCQSLYEKKTLCVANEDCPCELECAENYTCVQHVSADESTSVVDVCVLKNDLTCENNTECPIEAVCLDGFCEEKQCQTCQQDKCYVLCGLDEACTIYPDNNEAQCSDR